MHGRNGTSHAAAGAWRRAVQAAFVLLVTAARPAAAQSSPPDLVAPSTTPDLVARPAEDAVAEDTAPWLQWHTTDFFTSCDGNCAVSIYGGREVTTGMTSVFLLNHPTAPWNWQYGNAGLVAGTFSRRFATLFGALDLETEGGVGQRFGDMHATEFWLALDLRWTRFPWNDYVRTTVALADGPDYATRIDAEERRLSPTGTSEMLNYFSPEITFARPSDPDNEIFFRFHHRSGIFGLINNTHAGAQFATVGYRHRF
jgi:hypothetical protein